MEDLVDFEYFLHADEGADEETLRQRDRDIARELSDAEPSRRDLLRAWLERRRAAERAEAGEAAMLPGDLFSQAAVLLVRILAIAGLFAGGSLAGSLLAYDGVRPVNVSGYFCVLVLLQIGLLAILAVLLAARRFLRLSGGFGLLQPFLLHGLHRLMVRAGEAAAGRLAGERRTRMEAALGALRSRRMIYGRLLWLPVFTMAQLFGVAFNLGVLAVTLVRVLTADLAFGWQTTLQAAPEGVYRLVRAIAAPWAWALPEGVAHPTLAHIEGTRLILKDGIYNLATADLVSWWPFLCMGVLVYGLLPRALLALGGRAALRRALARVPFDQAACDRLVRRMQSPLLECPPAQPGGDAPSACAPPPPASPAEAIGGIESPAVVLMPGELAGACTADMVDRTVRSVFGIRAGPVRTIGGDLADDRAAIGELRTRAWIGRPAVVVVFEAWQPPILESLALVRDVRAALPERARIAVLLVGKPDPSTPFAPARNIDLRVWQQHLGSLGDAWLDFGSPARE